MPKGQGCTYCEYMGHNILTCPKRKKDEAKTAKRKTKKKGSKKR